MATYLQILNIIKDAALAQPNVNTVVREFIDLNREDTEYSAVVIQDRDGTRDRITEQDYITYTWHLGYVDRLTDDESNRDDIFSTGINVINNIVNSIRNTYFPELEVRVIDRFNTFNQRFTASCAGVYVVLAIDVAVSECVDGEQTDIYEKFRSRITENGHYHFIPDGRPFGEIDLEINVIDKEKAEERLVESLTSNGTFTFYPTPDYVFSDASITVDVHPTDRLVRRYTTNGQKEITGEFKDGTITIAVPEEKEEVSFDETVSWSSVVQSISINPPEGKVFSSGVVTVYPGQASSISEVLTSNGRYEFFPEQGSDYIDSVCIDVSMEGRLPETVGQLFISDISSIPSVIYPEEGTVMSRVDISSVVTATVAQLVVYGDGEYQIRSHIPNYYSGVDVSVDVRKQVLSAVVSSNGSYHYDPDRDYLFSSADISVDVHPSASLVETIASNGTTSFSGEWKDASITVDVHPSSRLVETIASNGTTSFSGEWKDASITVAVPTTVTVSMSQSAYDNLSSYDSNTIYLITG